MEGKEGDSDLAMKVTIERRKFVRRQHGTAHYRLYRDKAIFHCVFRGTARVSGCCLREAADDLHQ